MRFLLGCVCFVCVCVFASCLVVCVGVWSCTVTAKWIIDPCPVLLLVHIFIWECCLCINSFEFTNLHQLSDLINDLARATRRWTGKKICWNIYFKLKLISRATAATRILKWEVRFAAPAFCYILRTKKKGPLLCHIVLLQFHGLEALEACLEALPRSLPRNVLF